MATTSQIDANTQNAHHSTGPRTEAGKAASSRNAVTNGLYTKEPYVKPEDVSYYRKFCAALHTELAPTTLLQEILTNEITNASWRLQLCAEVEGGLNGFEEPEDKIRRSVERARARAHTVFHRSLNHLRRMQNEGGKPKQLAMQDLDTLLQPPADFLKSLDDILSETVRPGIIPSERPSETGAPGRLASFCKPDGHAAAASPQAPKTVQIPRSAPCPCKSGEKFKRCCGRNAPPVLSGVLNKAA
jgi:hypothetical protein